MKHEILMVDDEADMCWAVQQILTPKGYQVTAINNGTAALEVVKHSDYPLLLLDAKLPDIEGLQLAQAIRYHLPDCHIILLSGYFYCDDTVITDAMEQKIINDFIAKPFSNHDILSAVNRILPQPH